jgi:hypothetical protein
MGPLPVAACCATKPMNASMASRPFLISFSLYCASSSGLWLRAGTAVHQAEGPSQATVRAAHTSPLSYTRY